MNQQMQNDDTLPRVAQKLVDSEAAWISTIRVPDAVLRACITSYQTEIGDVETLMKAVGSAREEILR